MNNIENHNCEATVRLNLHRRNTIVKQLVEVKRAYKCVITVTRTQQAAYRENDHTHTTGSIYRESDHTHTTGSIYRESDHTHTSGSIYRESDHAVIFAGQLSPDRSFAWRADPSSIC